jgi:hypothetical protein
LKSDVTNKTVGRAVRQCLQQKQSKARTGQPAPTNEGVIIISNEPSFLDLTGNDDASPTMVTTLSGPGPTIPKPKCKQIRPNAFAIQQWRVDDLKAKRHKLEGHKAAVRLYNAKKQKPDGLLTRQVQVPSRQSKKCARAKQQSPATQSRDSSTHPQ